MAHFFVLSLANVGRRSLRGSRPGIPERRSAGVYFSDDKKENMVVEKNSYQQKITEVKVPRSKRRGD